MLSSSTVYLDIKPLKHARWLDQIQIYLVWTGYPTNHMSAYVFNERLSISFQFNVLWMPPLQISLNDYQYSCKIHSFMQENGIYHGILYLYVDYINVNVSITICRCVLLQNIFRAVTSSLRTWIFGYQFVEIQNRKPKPFRITGYNRYLSDH